MTLAAFKDMVAGYMNRTVASFNNGTTDFLLQAMNDARRAAQRGHDFELNRTEEAYLSTSSNGANWMTGAKTTPSGATAILMKRIDEVWRYGTTTVAGGTAYPRTSAYDFSYSRALRRELPSISRQSLAYVEGTGSATTLAYANGPLLYITNANSATIVKLVGIKFLDDLADGATPDIFLTYFTDWLKFATIGALNVYLKDGERFPIDATITETMWQSVKTFDGTIANMGESVDLD